MFWAFQVLWSLWKPIVRCLIFINQSRPWHRLCWVYQEGKFQLESNSAFHHLHTRFSLWIWEETQPAKKGSWLGEHKAHIREGVWAEPSRNTTMRIQTRPLSIPFNRTLPAFCPRLLKVVNKRGNQKLGFLWVSRLKSYCTCSCGVTGMLRLDHCTDQSTDRLSLAAKWDAHMKYLPACLWIRFPGQSVGP